MRGAASSRDSYGGDRIARPPRGSPVELGRIRGVRFPAALHQTPVVPSRWELRKIKDCPRCGVRKTSSTSGWCGPCRSVKRAAANKALVDARRSEPCTDCGLVEPEIMDLDHVPERGVKLFTVSGARSGVSTPKMLAELAKCDTVCPNCHRRRTIRRRLRA